MATLQSQINILTGQIHNLYKKLPEPKNNEISFDYGELKTTFTKNGKTTEINYLGSKSYDIIIYIGKNGNYILKSGDLIEPPTEENSMYLFEDKIYKLSDGDYIGINFCIEGSLCIKYIDSDPKEAPFRLEYNFYIHENYADVTTLSSGDDTFTIIDSHKNFEIDNSNVQKIGNIFTYNNNSFIINTKGIEIDLKLGDNSTSCTISDIKVQNVLLSNDIDQTKSDITSIDLGFYEVPIPDGDGDVTDYEGIYKYYGSNPLIQGERPAKVKLIAYNNSDLLDCIPKD